MISISILSPFYIVIFNTNLTLSVPNKVCYQHKLHYQILQGNFVALTILFKTCAVAINM